MKDRELIDKARKVAAKAETEKHVGAALLHYAHMLETTTEEKMRTEARFRLRSECEAAAHDAHIKRRGSD
jgi:hypothetical protein